MTVTRVLLGLLMVVGLGNGCSTQAIPDSSSDAPDTAWWAYQDCLDSLPRSSSPTLCNSVGTTHGQSPQSYTAGNIGSNVGPYPVSAYPQASTGAGYSQTGYTNGATGPLGTYAAKTSLRAARAPSGEVAAVQAGYAIAYREYLKTLDEKTLSELTQQWHSVSEQAAQ
jgi:hypothetical protein